MTDIERAQISAVWEFGSAEELAAFLDGDWDTLTAELERGLPVVLTLQGDSYTVTITETFDE